MTIPPKHYSKAEIRSHIPDHCFERSTFTSSLYLAGNLAICATLWYAASYIDFTPKLLQPFLWFAYWLVQGFFFTGIWVIGHECGHRAYSESNAVNDTVGLILHSALLVPYHSWRLTHGAHHMYTGHLGKDTVHVPPSRSQIPHWQEVISDTPIAAMIDGLQILVALTFGWPGYLMFNMSGQVYPTRTNHFEPGSPLFKPKDRRDILISDAALLVAFSVIALASATYGFGSVACYWGIPYLWTNMWLVLITYLHHTHKTLPKYREGEWNFTRGALATVDRDYGFLNYIFHHIGDTHIAHHMFSKMPHYHALEATKHLKKFLGEYYTYDNTPIWTATWREWSGCYFVPDEGEIVFAQPRAQLAK